MITYKQFLTEIYSIDFEDNYVNAKRLFTKPNIVKWNKILKEIKMTAILDESWIIYDTEPVQIYFNNIKDFRIKELILNENL